MSERQVKLTLYMPDWQSGKTVQPICQIRPLDYFEGLAAIARVLTGKSLIAPLVVAGDSGHELLGISFVGCFDFGQEVGSVAAAQCRSHASAVQDLKLTISPDAVAKPEVLAARF